MRKTLTSTPLIWRFYPDDIYKSKILSQMLTGIKTKELEATLIRKLTATITFFLDRHNCFIDTFDKSYFALLNNNSPLIFSKLGDLDSFDVFFLVNKRNNPKFKFSYVYSGYLLVKARELSSIEKSTSGIKETEVLFDFPELFFTMGRLRKEHKIALDSLGLNMDIVIGETITDEFGNRYKLPDQLYVENNCFSFECEK